MPGGPAREAAGRGARLDRAGGRRDRRVAGGRISDDFTGGRSRQDFFLEVLVNGAKQRLNVNPADASLSPDELTKLVGSTLKMRGLLLKDHLVVADRSKVEVLSAGGRNGCVRVVAARRRRPRPTHWRPRWTRRRSCSSANFKDKNIRAAAPRPTSRRDCSARTPTVQSMNRLYQETSRQLVSFFGRGGTARTSSPTPAPARATTPDGATR